MPSEEQRTFNPFIAFTEQWLEAWRCVNALGLQNLQGITLFGILGCGTVMRWTTT